MSHHFLWRSIILCRVTYSPVTVHLQPNLLSPTWVKNRSIKAGLNPIHPSKKYKIFYSWKRTNYIVHHCGCWTMYLVLKMPRATVMDNAPDSKDARSHSDGQCNWFERRHHHGSWHISNQVHCPSPWLLASIEPSTLSIIVALVHHCGSWHLPNQRHCSSPILLASFKPSTLSITKTLDVYP